GTPCSTLVSDAGAPHAARRLPGLARPKVLTVPLTVGDNLYAMDAFPSASGLKGFQALHRGDGHCSILVSSKGAQTYRFNTAARAWSKAGDWALPFSGLAEYAPGHRLWFGISPLDDGYRFCAANLAGAWGEPSRAPPIHGVWREIFEVVSWRVYGSPYGVPYQTTEAIHAAFTGVEVESCGQALRVLRHRSERHLLDSSSSWVLQ
ncbi:hypothetical protein BAE44_0005070, partial [Dichanthelium oligosanthes]